MVFPSTVFIFHKQFQPLWCFQPRYSFSINSFSLYGVSSLGIHFPQTVLAFMVFPASVFIFHKQFQPLWCFQPRYSFSNNSFSYEIHMFFIAQDPCVYLNSKVCKNTRAKHWNSQSVLLCFVNSLYIIFFVMFCLHVQST